MGIFVPGSGSAAIAVSSGLYQTAFSTDNRVIEFALSNSLFSGPTAGLPGQLPSSNFSTPGSDLRLNLSQSFGYSVAGGAPVYGTSRLGVVTFGGANASAVPEPATWGLMLLGFGAVGAGARYRRRRAGAALA